MNRTQKFILNVLSTGAYQITAMLMGFLMRKLMMTYYSNEMDGVIVSITGFIDAFKLVEAGLATAAVYSLYKPLADRDTGRIGAVVSATRGFYNATGLLFCGMTVAFAAIYPFILKTISLDALSLFMLVIIMGLSGALDLMTLARFRVLLTADQKTYIVSLASMASLLVQMAVIVALSVTRTNILLLRLLAGATILLRTALLSRYVKKHYPSVNYRAKPDKSALNNRFDALYNQLIAALQQTLGINLTTVILADATTVSVYGVYHMVIMGLWGVLKMVTSGIYSFFGEIIVRGDREQLKNVYNEFECFYLTLVTVIFAAALILIMPFAQLFTRSSAQVNYIYPLWGVLFVLQGLTDQVRMPLDLMITAAGAFQKTRHHNTAQVAVAVVLGVGLGLIWGVPGILLGIIASNVVRGGLQLYYVPKYITHLTARASLSRMLRVGVTFLVCCLPFYFFPLRPNHFLLWAVDAVWVALYCGAIALLLAFALDARATRALFVRVKRMVHKR